MKTLRTLCLMLVVAVAYCLLGTGTVFATGTATASGEPTSSTKRGDIVKDKQDRTGGLTVHKVSVLDKFGRRTRELKRDVDYTVEGDTSTSPSLLFRNSANLEAGERVTVEMISTKPGEHDLDINFS